MDMMKTFTEKFTKENAPQVKIGDTVRVSLKVKEGNRERTQVFEGTVIAKKHGGIEETFTVRRISYGVGVEKVFPVHSPIIEKVEVKKYPEGMVEEYTEAMRQNAQAEYEEYTSTYGNTLYPTLADYLVNYYDAKYFPTTDKINEGFEKMAKEQLLCCHRTTTDF